MAKKRKQNKRTRVTTKDRQDYRTGGRVGYRPGGRVPGEPGAPLPKAVRPSQRGRQTPPAPTTTPPAPTPTPVVTTQAPIDAEVDLVDLKDATTPTTPDTTDTTDTTTTTTPEKTEEQLLREKKAQETLMQSLEGKVPEAAEIPPAKEVDPNIKGQITQMAAPTRVAETQIEGVAPEQVTTVTDVAEAQRPEDITAAQTEAARVAEEPEVEAAVGEISDAAIAQAAGLERVAPIEGAQVSIPEGALQERVVGSLSQEAKAEAAKIAGSNLGRVTRAKKQLKRAGVSDDVITELGNDPEALEDALMDLPESERGVIEGLPEEALVSNQLDTLLSGIEEGEIPAWARPAVASVEAMLANRGMSASTVGRDALLNAIIQSAIPLAQSNAQAIQAAVSQERSIEAQRNIRQAELNQQTALQNAQNVFALDMAQFTADQQRAVNNSKFLQTVSLSEASFDQQAIVQNANMLQQMNLAEANFNQQAQIRNADAFLKMDMTNLSNQQQANVLEAQQSQQRILSNQAAENAAAQFNATSQNQTNQFMASLAAQTEQFNVSQMNATKQFNATQANAAEARNAQRQADINKANAQLKTQIAEFNANQDFARNQWNANNAAAVEASNVAWRRQANTANTAAQNAINMQNAQNAYNLTNASMSFLWQELRDNADQVFRTSESDKNRIAQLVNTALASDPDSYNNTAALQELVGILTADIMEQV